MANISIRNGGVLCPRTPSETRAEPQESGDIFLQKYNLKLTCTEEEVALMPVKDGSALRARLVDKGCHSFLSKRSGKVLKATQAQMSSMQVWRIPGKRISVNTLSERPEEAVGVLKDIYSLFNPCGNGEIHSCTDES